ncbi:DUF2259 domain-containing protein [Mesorhizobium sp. M5C.F.Ca.IN.020.29.1.1]|uniref:DUF2259 domain-containing protein n=1 Tax=unclassified Mesorhizobium TaxID=325217 RepID=UPI000FCC2393|nr:MULTISPECIES: DUF2259 domain-containing protein [unclassified Mesorhizobium]RUV48309.1 DUF2259 domain-containing protein [Mesorhizobium sp. M5C.F.Ca.IN.020.29.1.1]TIM81983.1 MAG: DUF2259 domain-containing protein [Mesorhizobium sp.]
MRRHGAFIGFSPDGTYFAFEQYGTLDAGASNSGWSEIEIIDTRTDEFVGGKPIRIVDETDAHSRSGEGTGCRAGGADPRPICQRRAASGRPLTGSAFRTTWSLTKTLRASTRSRRNGFRRPMTSSASRSSSSTRYLPTARWIARRVSTSSKGATAGKAFGFRLTLQAQDGKPFQLLHEDKTVPASRNCPTSYSLSESYAFTPDGKPAVLAVLVQRFSQGFEGLDRRFIAVTGQLR